MVAAQELNNELELLPAVLSIWWTYGLVVATKEHPPNSNCVRSWAAVSVHLNFTQFRMHGGRLLSSMAFPVVADC